MMWKRARRLTLNPARWSRIAAARADRAGGVGQAAGVDKGPGRWRAQRKMVVGAFGAAGIFEGGRGGIDYR